MESTVSYSMKKTKWHVYRLAGTRMEFIADVMALDQAEAAREVIERHHDWRNDGLEVNVVVVPAEAIRKVTVTFRPEAVPA